MAEPTRRHAGGRPPVLLTHQGRTQSAAAWAREIGISKQVLWSRLRAGWPLERALLPKAGEVAEQNQELREVVLGLLPLARAGAEATGDRGALDAALRRVKKLGLLAAVLSFFFTAPRHSEQSPGCVQTRVAARAAVLSSAAGVGGGGLGLGARHQDQLPAARLAVGQAPGEAAPRVDGALLAPALRLPDARLRAPLVVCDLHVAPLQWVVAGRSNSRKTHVNAARGKSQFFSLNYVTREPAEALNTATQCNMNVGVALV